MNAPSAPPADWRSRYGFDQGMSPEQQNYWAVNGRNGNQVANAVNAMPFVMNPIGLGFDPGANKQMMYQPAGQQAGADPLSMIMGLVQKDPGLLQTLLQRLGAGAGAGAPVSAGPVMPDIGNNNGGL